MLLLKNIERSRILKATFVVAGLILFATQLSGKFYQSASMPLPGSSVRVSTQQTGHCVAGETKTVRLSLDKRYDLTIVFDLPAPLFQSARYTVGIQRPIPPHAGNTNSGMPVLTLLRGPPSQNV